MKRGQRFHPGGFPRWRAGQRSSGGHVAHPAEGTPGPEEDGREVACGRVRPGSVDRRGGVLLLSQFRRAPVHHRSRRPRRHRCHRHHHRQSERGDYGAGGQPGLRQHHRALCRFQHQSEERPTGGGNRSRPVQGGSRSGGGHVERRQSRRGHRAGESGQIAIRPRQRRSQRRQPEGQSGEGAKRAWNWRESRTTGSKDLVKTGSTSQEDADTAQANYDQAVGERGRRAGGDQCRGGRRGIVAGKRSKWRATQLDQAAAVVAAGSGDPRPGPAQSRSHAHPRAGGRNRGVAQHGRRPDGGRFVPGAGHFPDRAGSDQNAGGHECG